MVFPSGRFITTTPAEVEDLMSILSTPTPALPITDSLLASLRCFEVI